MKNFFSIHIDSLGFSASVLCAIHCALMPFLLTFSALGSLKFLENPKIEIFIIILSLALALLSLLPACLKGHRKLSAIYIAMIGFILIGIGRAEIYESVITPVGACFVGFSHFQNWRLHRINLKSS